MPSASPNRSKRSGSKEDSSTTEASLQRKSTRTSSAKPQAAKKRTPSPAAAKVNNDNEATVNEARVSHSPPLFTKTYPSGNGAPYSTGVPLSSAASPRSSIIVGSTKASLLGTTTTIIPQQLPPQRAVAGSQRISGLTTSTAKKSTLIAPPYSTEPSTAAIAARVTSAIAPSHVVGATNAVAKTQPYLVEADFADSAYYPHTVVFLFILCGLIAFAAHLMTGSNDTLFNIKVGFGSLAFAFLTFCAVYLPDELFIRPHPAVWRVLTGVNILYVSLIIFLMFQDVPTIRGYLARIDPRLANDLPERSYAEDCRLSTPEEPNKWFSTIFDEFLLAHFLGYFCKTLIIRDWRLVMMISVLFEVVELSFQHILPNFKECWWDHLIIDILICNAGGMIAGLIFLRVFGLGQFQWTKLTDISTFKGKIRRVASQLAPRQIDPYQWQMFSSPRRLAVVVFLLVYNLIQEFNCFTIKSILQMPSNHRLTIGRLMIWGFIAIGACRGLYVYAVEEGPLRAKRVPMAAWLGFTTLFCECVWINKMRKEGGYFQEPMPAYVGVPLYTSFCLFILWFFMHFMMPSFRKNFNFRVATNIVFYLVPCCLIALFFMANVDMKWGQKQFMGFVEAYRPFGFGPLEEGHLMPKRKDHLMPKRKKKMRRLEDVTTMSEL